MPPLEPPVTAPLFGTVFSALAKQLQARLEASRAALTHSGSKGTSAEQAFREILAQYLPRRLAFAQGEVIDTFGSRSSQTDAVILSEDHPFNFGPDEPSLLLVEGVLAAGEVKSVLTANDLQDAVKKSRRFKALKARPSVGMMRLSTPSDSHFSESPPYFLFAYESQLELSTIAEKLIEAEGVRLPNGRTILDAVFVLDRGEVVNLGDGMGGMQILKESGEHHTGWVTHPGNDVLLGLVVWLSLVMPRSHRFVPILPDYLIATRA